MKTNVTVRRQAVLFSLCVGVTFQILAAPPVTDGLKFWVDASDVSSVTTNAGGKVSQWNDLSGTDNHVAQTVDAQKPVYNPTGLDGKPSLSFNSTNVLFKAGSLLCYSNHTAFLVAKATSVNENDMLGSGGTGAGDILVMHYDNKVSGNNFLRGHYWGASGAATKDSAIKTAVSTPLAYAQRMNGTALELYRNGALDASQPYSSFSANKKGIVLGYRTTAGSNGKCFAGEMSEVLIYERALSDAERAQVEAYLIEKWLGDYAPVQPTPVTSGLKFRADASASQTVLTNDAGKVLQWFDLSGNGYHLQQRLTDSRRPVSNPMGLNGKPSLTFTGSNVLLTTASTINYSNHTVFVVAKARDNTTSGWGNDLIGANMGSVNGFLLTMVYGYYNATYWPTNNATSVIATSKTPVTFAPTLYEQRLDDSGMEIFRNGLSDSAAAVGLRTNVLNGVSVGYRIEAVTEYGFVGEISEVLIYDRALSVSERQQVENHLTNKWFTVPVANGLPVTRNLKFRVDASDASTIVTTALGRVERWSGKGPTEFFVRQTVPEKQPTYKPDGLRWRPSLAFNGTNVMAFPFNAINYSNHTVFVVAQATVNASGNIGKDILGSGGTSPGDILLMNFQNKYRGHYWATTNIAVPIALDSVSATVLAPVIYGQTLSDTGFRIYRNGQLDNAKTTGLSYTNVLRSVILGSRQAGGSDYFVGEMSEAIIYDCALTDEERQQVEAYLYEKWLRDRRGTLLQMF